MAKFLNTSATNYHLEEMIKRATDRLILISPYLRLNDRVKELLEDKNRLKIDVRIVYGKTDLRPDEADWLKGLDFVRTSFCKNLHAKCYMSEDGCIITSLNLYEFSQVNNNEMGVYINRETSPELYRDAYEEAQRIIRVSEEVKIAMDRVPPPLEETSPPENEQGSTGTSNTDSAGKIWRLTTSKLASKHKVKTAEMQARLGMEGFLAEDDEGKPCLTQKALDVGATANRGKHGMYFLWPEAIFG